MLKHLVTGDALAIERKGMDTVTMPNYTRLLITSDEEWVWPTEVGDRRIVVFQVERAAQPDAAYFEALHAELADGGHARLLYLLQRGRIDEHRLLKRLPETMALEDQVSLTASPEGAWLRELLIEGTLPMGRVDAECYAHVPVKALHAHYAERAGRFPKNKEQLGVFLKKHLPRPKDVPYRSPRRLWQNGQHVQSRPRVIPPLAECRARYERLGRGAPRRWSARSAGRITK